MLDTLRVRADIVVQDSDGNVLALVEVKNRQDLTPEIAATLRCNLFTHGLLKWHSRFFLLFSQEWGYLWDHAEQPDGNSPLPYIKFPMEAVVRYYLPSSNSETRLTGSQLEIAVTQWLWDLARDAVDRPRGAEETALGTTEFLKMMKGGRVGTEIQP